MEKLESNGQVSNEDKASMLESYVQFTGQFGDDHAEEYNLGAHESKLWQYGSTNLSLRRLMQLSFCVCGNVNQVHQFAYPSLPILSSDEQSSMLCTILSWCKSRGMRSVQSIPDDLVAEKSDAVGRAIELQADSME